MSSQVAPDKQIVPSACRCSCALALALVAPVKLAAFDRATTIVYQRGISRSIMEAVGHRGRRAKRQARWRAGKLASSQAGGARLANDVK
mmetsp:Transcript_35168/g.113046  ORF Transcript_35168/g.113046 Transcript_35168/m.113046 type:complete len:89 (-) Transcript_35168:496-762(-)